MEREHQITTKSESRHSHWNKVMDVGVRLTTIFLLGVAGLGTKVEVQRAVGGDFWKPTPIERLPEDPSPTQKAAAETEGYADLGMIAMSFGALAGAGLLEFQRRIGMFRADGNKETSG